MGYIEVIANAITREEQLEMAKLLVKAGYTVGITKGKVVDGKGRSYIKFEREKVKENG